MENILPKTTEAKSSKSFSPRGGCCTIQVCGLATGETATIEVKNFDTGEFVEYVNACSQFDDKNNVLDIYNSFATYRVTKSVTADEIGIWLGGVETGSNR